MAGAESPAARYTYGYSSTVVQVHQQRTAAREAAFFLPWLQPGMRLLDAGCGPGSITAGLAAALEPDGVTLGLDIEPAVLPRGDVSGQAGDGQPRYLAGSATRLPFAEGTFDAVFGHTLLEHLPEPEAALRELWRVLRPGGVLGLRDCDWESGVFAPEDALVRRAYELFALVWRSNSGHPTSGRQLRGWVQALGASEVVTSASFRWDGSAGESRAFGELLAARLLLPNFRGPIIAHGWATDDELVAISAACRTWSKRPDAFAAMLMCEAVAVKPR